MEPVLEARCLKKNYGDFTAVDNISFHLNRGELFGFLGPNGAGKTTTINMLIGMAKISGGSVRYKGEDLTADIKKAQSMIGVVADESNLYDEMSGHENLCFCGALYGLPKSVRESRAAGLLDLFQLADAGRKKFAAYSKGMKRKLTIAAALVHEPEILFLDEPTTGIDVASVRQIRSLIKKLNGQGTAVFMTTHYIDEAERLCDRVAFINKGKIIASGSVGQMLEDVRESKVIEVVFEPARVERERMLEKLRREFPDIECGFKNDNTLRVTSPGKIDISPIVGCISSENVFVYEARLITPTLEDAFVRLTGIEADVMKKEKEKK